MDQPCVMFEQRPAAFENLHNFLLTASSSYVRDTIDGIPHPFDQRLRSRLITIRDPAKSSTGLSPLQASRGSALYTPRYDAADVILGPNSLRLSPSLMANAHPRLAPRSGSLARSTSPESIASAPITTSSGPRASGTSTALAGTPFMSSATSPSRASPLANMYSCVQLDAAEQGRIASTTTDSKATVNSTILSTTAVCVTGDEQSACGVSSEANAPAQESNACTATPGHVRFALGRDLKVPCEHAVRSRIRAISLPPNLRVFPAIPEDREGEEQADEASGKELRRARPRAYTMMETRPALQGLNC